MLKKTEDGKIESLCRDDFVKPDINESTVRKLVADEFNDLLFNGLISADTNLDDLVNLYMDMDPDTRLKAIKTPMDKKRKDLSKMLNDRSVTAKTLNWDWNAFVDDYIKKAEDDYEKTKQLRSNAKNMNKTIILEKLDGVDNEHKKDLYNKLKVNQDLLGVRDYPEINNTTAEDSYEYVNHPDHYNEYDIEVIDMMDRIWGHLDTKKWCVMTAFKYRMRMGKKPGESIEKDLEKEHWYLEKAKELQNKMDWEIEGLIP